MILKVAPSDIYTFRYELGLTSTDIDFIDADNTTCGAGSEQGFESGFSVHAWGDRAQVLGMCDPGANIVDGDHTGFTINPTGSIEFMFQYYLSGAPGADAQFILYDGATRLVKLIFDESALDFGYDNGGGFTAVYDSMVVSTWYIIRIDIDINAGVNGQFDLYVKNSGYTTLDSVTGIEFENNATKIDKLQLKTDDPVANTPSLFLIDCIGITAEGGYTAGDIQYAETNIGSYVFNTKIYDGIIPHRKRFIFECHPDNHSYFNELDFIDVFDNSNNEEFIGYIKTKSRLNTGFYRFDCESMTNEVFERTYDKSWATNTTKEKVQDMIPNALQFCTEGTLDAVDATDWSYEYNRACAYILYLNRFMDRQVVYIEPDGVIYAKDYDGLTASGESWNLSTASDKVILMDLPGIEEKIPGYYFGNTGVTSVVIRYKDDTTATRPSSPTETFRKKRIKEFVDPKLQAVTEANQLGDNTYAIFTADTTFLNIRTSGKGWLQPGETVQIQSSQNPAITQAHFLIVSVIYDPQNDVHERIIFSSNIITLSEFISEFDTSQQQIHTAVRQSCENQASINDLGSTYYTETEVAAFLAIGSGNKKWIPCILEGASAQGDVNAFDAYRNIGANNMSLSFGIPLPTTLGSGHNLVLTQLCIGITDSDANDYVDRIRIYSWSIADPPVGAALIDIDHDTVSGTGTGKFTHDHADQTIGGNYERCVIIVDCANTDALQLDIAYIKVEYYYT